MNPNRKNLANAFLADPITASATTMTYVAGYGAGKPAVPYFDTLTPQGQLSTMGNSEIVQVTALAGDVATIVRARKGTDAKPFPAGTIASNGIYVEDKVSSENIDWAMFAPVVYSTTEQRVGTWIDGKPVYRKSIPTGNLGNNSTVEVSHGISNFGSLVQLYGSVQNSVGTTLPLPMVADVSYSNSVAVWVSSSSGWVRIWSGGNRSAYSGYVTLEYTKTTD